MCKIIKIKSKLWFWTFQEGWTLRSGDEKGTDAGPAHPKPCHQGSHRQLFNGKSMGGGLLDHMVANVREGERLHHRILRA